MLDILHEKRRSESKGTLEILGESLVEERCDRKLPILVLIEEERRRLAGGDDDGETVHGSRLVMTLLCVRRSH